MGKMGNVQCYTAIRKGKIKSMRCNIELAETVVLLGQKEKRAGSDDVGSEITAKDETRARNLFFKLVKDGKLLINSYWLIFLLLCK